MERCELCGAPLEPLEPLVTLCDDCAREIAEHIARKINAEREAV